MELTQVQRAPFRGLSHLEETLTLLWPDLSPQDDDDVILMAPLVGPQGEAGGRRVDPNFLVAVVAWLRRDGARVRVLACPMDLEDTRTFEATVSQLREAGVEVLTEPAVVSCTLPGALIREVSLFQPFIEATCRIVLAKAATHHTHRMAGCGLSSLGALAASSRSEFFRQFPGQELYLEAMEELATLTRVDGALIDLGAFEQVLVGGRDVLSVDRAAQEILETRTLRDAREMLPPVLGAYPNLDPTLCTSCGSCAELCPTQAVTLVKEKARVTFDYNACLRCGVCVSVCPDFAITASLHPKGARLVRPDRIHLVPDAQDRRAERVPLTAALALGPKAIDAPPRRPAWLKAYTPPTAYELRRGREREPEAWAERTKLPRDGRVRLIIPPIWGIQGNRSALGVAYLAAVLEEEGFAPHILDLAFELRLHDPALNEALEVTANPDPNGGFYGPRVPLLLEVVDPDAFGDSAPEFSRQVYDAARNDAARICDSSALFGLTVADSSVTYSFALGAALKRLGCRVILGGPTMSHQPTAELALRAGVCDAVVMGEGEGAIRVLAALHRDGLFDELAGQDVPGLGLLHEGRFRLSPNQRNRGLDQLPFPVWRGQQLPPDFMPILAARGCVTRCSFCSEQTISPKFAQRSVENVLEEMDRLHAEFKCTTFEFSDDLLNGNMKWLKLFCEALIERGSPYAWQGLCRPHRLEPDVLVRMRDAGCVQLSFGVQHFSWRMLKIMGRKEEPDPIKTVLRNTLNLGIQAYVDIILGHPGEDEEDVQITLDAIVELMGEFPHLDININPYNHIYGSATDVFPQKYGVRIERFSEKLPEVFSHLQGLLERFVVWGHQTPDPETVLDRVNRLAWTVFQARRPTKIPILNEELPFCNDNCLHCGVADIMKTANVVPFSQISASLKTLAPASGGRVMFAVSELTIRPDFLKIMRASRRAGMTTVAVVTNGRMFAYPKFTAQAVASGMTHALVSVYGPTPRTHHAITRTPGSFEQTIQGITELRKYPQVTLMTNSVITKKNMRYLPQMVEMIAGLGVKNVNLSFVQIIGAAAQYQKALIPRIRDVLPYLREAVDLGVALGLRVGIGGLPYCVLKGYEHHFGVDDLTYIENSDQVLDNITARSPYTKAKACARCAFNAVCLGMQEEYLHQFGEEELAPYHGRRHVQRPETDIVRAMFPEFGSGSRGAMERPEWRETEAARGLESHAIREEA